MTKPVINCYVCGTWIKPIKGKKLYKCSKCKATYELKNGKIVRVYS